MRQSWAELQELWERFRAAADDSQVRVSFAAKAPPQVRFEPKYKAPRTWADVQIIDHLGPLK